jgi:hypothetical protein
MVSPPLTNCNLSTGGSCIAWVFPARFMGQEQCNQEGSAIMRLLQHSIMPFPIEGIKAVMRLTDSIFRSVKDLVPGIREPTG